MNKQALKLKEKRRSERLNNKLKEKEKLFDAFNQYRKNQNLNCFAKNNENLQLVNKYIRQVDGDILSKSGVNTLVISIYILFTKFNYSKTNVISYAKKLKMYIDNIALNKISINLIEKELTLDYDIDIFNLRKKYENVKTLDMIQLSVNYFPYFLMLSLYAYMNIESKRSNDSWTKHKMNEFVNHVNDQYENIINKKINICKLKSILSNNYGVDVNLQTGDILFKSI